jgi:rhamnose utilization protein RhaD (predicted bifunctional aldolase and dehydrogenase)
MSKPTTTAQDLIDRSNRLGADPRNTNYAGGIPPPRAPKPTP